MLSVLIPTYNYNALPLVRAIHKQLIQANITFEILCFDDGSDESFLNTNKAINELGNCTFKTLKRNIGRSKIRNRLAKQASFEFLLFLDSDVLPINATFINTYLNSLGHNDLVLCGGIKYEDKAPKKTRTLRWVYGKEREENSLTKRTSQPYHFFLSANFLISKSIFKSIGFNEDLSGYGYEDILFSHTLNKNEFNIQHIDNAVYHLGIETNQRFLVKTEASIKNLRFIYKNGLLKKEKVRLLSTYTQLSHVGLVPLFSWLFKKRRNWLMKRLSASNPSLFLFDLYKLGYLCSLNSDKIIEGSP